MSDAIHPSAVIDPRARLGQGVRVGAFCVIGPEAVLEDDVEVGHHVVLEGRVALGPRAKVGHGCVIGGVPQDLKWKDGTPSGVRVGAGTVLREYVTIHRSTRAEGWTEIGGDCLVMAMSHVAHDCRLGDGVIVINSAGITGHCEIGDRATIGGLTGIVPFTRVGAYAYVGGMAKVTADVPPYVLVDGQPATARSINVIGLRRAGMNAADRQVLQDAFRLLYRSGLAPARAVERIREEVPAAEPIRLLLDFITRATRHGIVGGWGGEVPVERWGGEVPVEGRGGEAPPQRPPGSRGALHGSGQPEEVSD